MGLGNLNTILVTGRYVTQPDGLPVAGTVSFSPSAVVHDPAGNQILLPKTVTATLDGTGFFSVALAATNDPDITPTFTYQVNENMTGGRVYNIEVPWNSPGGTLDLADVAPVVSGVGSPFLVTLIEYNIGIGQVANGYTVVEWTGISWPQRPSAPQVIWTGGTSANPPPGLEDDIWMYT